MKWLDLSRVIPADLLRHHARSPKGHDSLVTEGAFLSARMIGFSKKQHEERSLIVSLIGIKPIIKCESQRSCKSVGTRPSPSGDRKNCFLDFSSLDKSPEFAYENTSFDYEFVSPPHDG